MSEFEYDLFISYAHRDNKTQTKDQKGFVSMLAESLELKLSEEMYENPKIWSDHQLRGHDRLESGIAKQLRSSALLLTVISKPYLSSKWCELELDEFLKHAEKTGGIFFKDKLRIFKVLKTQLPLNEHPPPLDEATGYEFYKKDRKGKPFGFYIGFGQELSVEYWERINDLVHDICESIDLLKGKVSQSSENRGPVVYLAETTQDLEDYRNSIQRELKDSGCRVLPERALPNCCPELESEVREYLKQAEVVVHPVGARYGFIPEASEKSVVEIQMTLSAEAAGHSGLHRLIWRPADLEIKEQRQRDFVEFLRDDPGLGSRDDFLETSFEELKNVLHEKIYQPDQPDKPHTSELVRVYIISDPADGKDVRPIEDHLYDQGYEILSLNFETDGFGIKQQHLDNLEICDVVLIHWGGGSEGWMQQKLSDLRKAPGYRKSRSFMAKAVYVSGSSKPKDRFRTREVDEIIHGTGPFDPASLNALIKKINSWGGAS